MISFIAALTDWTRRLAYLVLAVTFLELLAPDNQLKKLVKVVIGFFITAAIVMPVVNYLRTERGLEELPFYTEIVPSSAGWESASFAGAGVSQAEKLYRSSVEMEIVRRLQQEGISAGVEVTWSTDQGLRGVKAFVKDERDAQRVRDFLQNLLSLAAEDVQVIF